MDLGNVEYRENGEVKEEVRGVRRGVEGLMKKMGFEE